MLAKYVTTVLVKEVVCIKCGNLNFKLSLAEEVDCLHTYPPFKGDPKTRNGGMAENCPKS